MDLLPGPPSIPSDIGDRVLANRTFGYVTNQDATFEEQYDQVRYGFPVDKQRQVGKRKGTGWCTAVLNFILCRRG
jgi:hypothetical protein